MDALNRQLPILRHGVHIRNTSVVQLILRKIHRDNAETPTKTEHMILTPTLENKMPIQQHLWHQQTREQSHTIPT
ncbi:hypothetical protein Pdw03_8789 [Penicillium digitatum]|uniref:Uncharacterized protein n=1 Tax=Penicillium digitatum TaxID=36651 RepID=A0A7T6XPB9_PENDI|nr:hypothetical protein Pdw03_8789 [Penicillium digitatum]